MAVVKNQFKLKKEKFDEKLIKEFNYLKEKPTSNFAGVGQSENYEVEIPDTFSEEEAHEIGEKAEALMRKTKYYEPRVAVRVVLEGKDTI